MMKNRQSIPEISISGLGLVTAVGHDCRTACASIRAGLKRPRKLSHFYVPNKLGHDCFEDGLITGHPVLDTKPGEREDRIMTLLAMALYDLKQHAGLDESLLFDSRVFLALPGPDRSEFDEKALRLRLKSLAEWPFDKDHPVECYPKGHAGMLFAMTDAVEALQRGDIERAVVVGSDSLIGLKDLSALHINERLKTEMNPDGLIPGEAAAALLLEKTNAIQRRKGSIKSMIKIISTAYDPVEAPGTGLTDAIAALVPYDDKPLVVDAVICDLNGEPGRFDEWALAQGRVFHRIQGSKNLICPAKNTGDTGAASAGLAICIASCAMERGYLATHPRQAVSRALVVSSSDSGERGALLLESYEDLP